MKNARSMRAAAMAAASAGNLKAIERYKVYGYGLLLEDLVGLFEDEGWSAAPVKYRSRTYPDRITETIDNWVKGGQAVRVVNEGTVIIFPILDGATASAINVRTYNERRADNLHRLEAYYPDIAEWTDLNDRKAVA